MELSATYRPPTASARAIKERVSGKLVCQRIDRAMDHAERASRRVGRAKVGATIGRVFRPISRSPTLSLKSCACIVVAKIPALAHTDMQPIQSRLCGSLPRQLRDVRAIYVKMRGAVDSPAMSVAPTSKAAKPAALFTFRTSQCFAWKPSSSYEIVRATSAMLA